MSTVASQTEIAIVAPDHMRRAAIGALLITAALVVLFWEFFSRQARWAFAEPADWGHTLVIPLIAGYFVWLNRQKLLARPFHTNWLGLGPIVAGMAWYVLCWLGPPVLRHHNLMGAGVMLTLLGIVWLFTGTRALLLLLFPLAYLAIFGQSISDRFMNGITFKLQDITAVGSHVALRILGFDAELKGNTIYISYGGEVRPLNIAEACSGMRMLMAFLALGVAMAYTGLRRFWQRTILVLLALPTAVFVNILRVCTLALLSLVNADFATGDFHHFIGLVWLVPAFLIYLGFMWILKRVVVEGAPPATKPQPSSPPLGEVRLFDRRAKWALLVALTTLMASGLGFSVGVKQLNVHLKKLRVDMRSNFSTIPTALGPWERLQEGAKLDEATVEELGTKLYFDRLYGREIDGRLIALHVHLTYYTDMLDAVPHVPDRCFLAGGLVQQGLARHDVLNVDESGWFEDAQYTHHSGERYVLARVADPFTGLPTSTVRMPVGEYEWRTIVFQDPDRPEMLVFSGYMFVANGAATAWTERIRALAFELDQKYAYYSKIQITWQATDRDSVEAYLSYVADMLRHLLPHYMNCLPDWAEVESSPASQSASK